MRDDPGQFFDPLVATDRVEKVKVRYRNIHFPVAAQVRWMVSARKGVGNLSPDKVSTEDDRPSQPSTR